MILDCFEYNQHFVAMMNIINLARRTNLSGKFERHHIIPKCYFKHMGIKIDNSESNLVNLTYEQHKKVHELAVLCAKPIILLGMRRACQAMNFKTPSRDGGHHTEETRLKISNTLKGRKRPPEVIEKIRTKNIGRKATPEARKHMSESHIGHKPWNYGLKTGHNEKHSEALRGRHPWNYNKKRVIVDGKITWIDK